MSRASEGEAVSARPDGTPPGMEGRSEPRHLLAAPLVALGFLTVLPVPAFGILPAKSLAWALAWFPLAGASIGLLVAGADLVLRQWFPPALLAALLLSLILGLTGGLHLDGLMDSFDGIFGGKTPADRLAIMKDSRVGSFGVAAAVCVLLLEYGAIASLPVGARGQLLVLALGLSRWSMVGLLWVAPPAAPTGLAATLKPAAGTGTVAAATIFAGALSWLLLGWTGMMLAAVATVGTFGAYRLALARLGGITGDSCGATGMLVEVAVLVAAVGLSGGM